MVELIIYTQPGCLHCEEVKPEIDYIKANFAAVTHIDLNKNSQSYQKDIALFQKYGGIGTPSGVLIMNGKATLYGGQENFKNNYLATQYQNAIVRDNLTKVAKTKVPDNVIIDKVPVVDPPPPSNNKKTIAIAAGVLILILILK
jgi:glutaredoxin